MNSFRGWVMAGWLVACGGGRALPDAAAGGEGVGGSAGADVGGSQATTAGTSGSPASGGAVSGGGASPSGGAGASPSGGAGASPSGGAALGECDGKSNALSPWPGAAEITTLEPEDQFQANLSGLTLEPGSDVLWAVDNIPGTLFRLVPSSAGFGTDAANGWANGKGLRYPNGDSAPDAEGVTFGGDVDSVYVCSEHDNASVGTSRQSVLRFALDGVGSTLTASHEWDLTSVLPNAGANTGIEAITWIPDAHLTASGFHDEAAQRAYDPDEYGDHGAGLFLVGVEESGRIYAVALDHTRGAARLVATIVTPNAGVMGLEFDRDAEQLWYHCDETCGNQSGILAIDTRESSEDRGRFVVVRRFERPAMLPDSNHEGIALGPDSACQAGLKPFFWTDDADVGGFSLRRGSVPCGRCP